MKIEWFIEKDVGILYCQENPVKSDTTVKELNDSNFNVIVTIADYDYSLSWREGSRKSVRHYQCSLSNYPEPSNWELKHLNEYLLYEIDYNRRIALWFEKAQTEKVVKDSISRFFKYEDVGLSAFVKSKLATQRERVIDIPPKLTHCHACHEKGCMTDHVCHVTSVTDAAKILQSGVILSACKAREESGHILSLEDRNAAGDPPDYFEYIMFTFGNCTAGDRLVMERTLGRFPTDMDLIENFYPGVRFYFRYKELVDHPGFCSDGYHYCKIKNKLDIKQYLIAVIAPRAAEPDLLKVTSPKLKKYLMFLDHTKYSDLWLWSHRAYELAESKKNVIVKESKIHGRGVFAVKDFKRGEPILNVDDSHIVTNTSKLTKKNYDFDLDFLANDKIVWMQPPGKYINHSCSPNVYFKTIGGIRKIYAIRDILKGEELTHDYSMGGWGDATFKCNCGTDICRNTWHADFFKLPMSTQKKYLPYLEDWFKKQFKEKLTEASMIKGNVIYLIPATLEEKGWIYEALTHPTIAPLCNGPPLFPDNPIPTWEEFCEDYKDFYFDGSALDKGMNYIVCVGDERIGVISYTCYHLRKHKAELDIWMNHIKNCGKGYGPDAIRTLCRYLYRTRRIKEFIIRPSTRNKRAVRAYEKAGFGRIYTERSKFIKNEFLSGYGTGDYEDEIRLGLKIEE